MQPKNNMKVGVVTFHNAHNYGATLQTWALQKTLKKLDAEPCVVHYHPDIIDHLYEVPKLDTAAKRWKYLSKKSERVRRRKIKIKYHRYRAFLNQNLTMAGDYRTWEELKNNPPGLDCYIVGSDQVWNPDHTGGFDPAYILDFAEERAKKIAYAASVGRERFPAQYREQYKSAIQKFDAVSVREPSAAAEVSEAFGREVPVVLDPTLLLERAEYDEIKVPSERKEKYILVYMMETNKKLVRLANRLSVVTGLPIIQRRQGKVFRNELPSFFTEHPGEFLGEIEKAEYVVTNSFHGTVFSIIYERPFISMLHSETGSRTSDLLMELGMEKHLLMDGKDFKSMGQFTIEDKAGLRRRIGKMRANSIEFLKGAL